MPASESPASSEYRPVKQDIWACALLAAATVGVFWQWLFASKALYWGDIGLYFLPMQSFAARELHRGIIPLWNPHLLCGEPYFGDPQVWPLYPSSLLASALPAATVLTVTCVLHIFLAGLFFYFFLRSSRATFWPAAAGAVAYMFGGYLVSKAQFPNMLQAMAYVPLALLLTQRLVDKPALTRAAGLGAALGLQLLAAHAQVSLATFYLAAAYGLWRWGVAGTSRAPFRRLALYACLAGALGFGLSCGQWLPVAQLVEHAERQTLSLGAANRFYLPWYEVTNFFWPFRLGSPMHGNWTAPGNFWEVCCFVGPIPVLLAAYAAHQCARNKVSAAETDDIAFWLIVFAASLWLALGRAGGLYILAFYLAPGVKAFHDPARMLLGAAVAIPVLAAIGMELLARRLTRPSYQVAANVSLFLLTLLPLAWFVHDLHPLKPVRDIESMAKSEVPVALRADPVLASRGGRIFMADPYKTWIYFTSYKHYAQNDPNYLSHWADTMTPNLPILFGIDQAGGYEPEAVKSTRAAASLAESWAAPANDRRFAPSGAGALADLLSSMSVRAMVVYRERQETRPGLTLYGYGGWQQNGNRVWVYRNSRFLPRSRSYLNWSIKGRSFSPAGKARGLRLDDLGPDRVDISVPANHAPILVVLADTILPGWKALVGGKLVPVVAVDGLFRGVVLPPGPARHIVFSYRPEAFTLGLYVTLLTLACLSGIITWRVAHKAWQIRTK